MFKLVLCIFVLGFTSAFAADEVTLTSTEIKGATVDAKISDPRTFGAKPGGHRILEEGKPVASVLPTVEAMDTYRQVEAKKPANNTIAAATSSNNLRYFGGVNGVGVQTAPKVYLIFWGSQWIGNDPSSEASTLINFFNGVGGSSWLRSVTQYCQGVAYGTTFCNGMGAAAGNQTGMLAGVWYDTGVVAPASPTQAQLELEAVRAINAFGNTTASKNNSVQYIIATARGNSSAGFGSQFCAWHSAVSTSIGPVAYVNLPYTTDAGSSCGANLNSLGSKAGITMVAGHELAETITDPFPSTGWTDATGSENADKCAWIRTGYQGASTKVTFSTGSFPVQSLWSNAFKSGTGGCVISY